MYTFSLAWISLTLHEKFRTLLTGSNRKKHKQMKCIALKTEFVVQEFWWFGIYALYTHKRQQQLLSDRNRWVYCTLCFMPVNCSLHIDVFSKCILSSLCIDSGSTKNTKHSRIHLTKSVGLLGCLSPLFSLLPFHFLSLIWLLLNLSFCQPHRSFFARCVQKLWKENAYSERTTPQCLFTSPCLRLH